MLWFRVGAVVFIGIVLIWGAGVAWGVFQMFSFGGTTKSMVDDPGRNGTVTVYVCLCAVEILIICACIFGLVIAFRMWRNNYQIDHSLRHLFIIWLGMWGVSCVICLSIGVFMLVKGKDNQENMAVLYDTFQRNAQDPKFVSTLEKYQRENQCCGVYSSDDWFMLQLRQVPQGGGGGGGYQSLDYGFRQNPSTGKCHMVPPTIPPGCGLRMMEEIHFRLKIYAAATVAEVIIAAITGALCWYCFFYWLEKEVIVIPEDEVSNVIIIEPESEATVVERGPSYLPMGHISRRQMSYIASRRENYSRRESQLGAGSERSNRGSYYHRNVTSMPYESRGGYLHQSVQERMSQPPPQLIHLSHDAILKGQEEAIGGHLLAEMHIEHKNTKMVQATGSKAGQHHATVAVVRNKHQPKPKQLFAQIKGHHGQTENLAQDITDMSGGKARGYIEDVVVPVEPPGMRPHAVQIPIGAVVHSTTQNNGERKSRFGFGSHEMRAANAQNVIEGVISPDEEMRDRGRVPSVVVSRPHELPTQGGHYGRPYLQEGGRYNPERERYPRDERDVYLGSHPQQNPSSTGRETKRATTVLFHRSRPLDDNGV